GGARGRDPSARPHESALGTPVALSRLARLAGHRLADPRGTIAAPRPPRARDPAGIRLPPSLERGRPRDLGQPRDHASRPRVRRHEVRARAPPGDDPRRRGIGPTLTTSPSV